MSTPSWCSSRWSAIFAGACASVMSSGQCRPAEPARHRVQLIGLGGHVEADDVGSVAGEHLGDRRPDPARGAGDKRHLAVQRLLGIDLLDRRHRLADPHDLAGDIGGLRRQEEAQRRLQLGAPGSQVEQLSGGPVADLLADRADEALERALGDRRGRGGAHLRRGAHHDHAAGVPHLTDPRVKERPCLAELIARADPGGVVHERLERLARRDQVRADRFEERLEGAGVVRGGGGAEQHRAFDHRLPRLIALERDRGR